MLLLDDAQRVMARDDEFCRLMGLAEHELPLTTSLPLLAERNSLLAALVEAVAMLPVAGGARRVGGLTIAVKPMLDNMRLVSVATDAAIEREIPPANAVDACISAAAVGPWEFDPHSSAIRRHDLWWDMLGYERDMGFSYESMVHPDDANPWRNRLVDCVQRGECFASELRLRAACGGWRWVLSRGRRLVRDGKVCWVGADTDISDLKACFAHQGLLASVVDVIPHGVMISDAGGRIQSVNAAFTQITGYTADEAVDRHIDILNSGIHHAVFYQHIWSAVSRRGMWAGEIWNRRKNGEVYPEWMTLICLRDRHDEITHYATVFEDITTRKREEERMAWQAYHDPLTELPNRLLFGDRLEQTIAQAMRTREMVAVLFVDLDGFKPVNDENGHDVGDALLKLFAHRLTASVRTGDTVARLAGDEFTLIVPHITSKEDVVPIAQKVLTAAVQPFHIAGSEIRVGASIGISLFPLHGDGALQLLKRADQAMYRAKHAGRSNWQFFE